MNKKLICSVIITILCMGIIFFFSNENHNSSDSLSKGFINNSIKVYEKLSGKSVDINKKKIVEKLNYPVRKIAHYSIYFILGLFVYQILLYLNVKHKIIFSILICMIYATTDEFHQIFIDGRTPKVFDILIDTIGSTTSILIESFMIRLKRSKKNN